MAFIPKASSNVGDLAVEALNLGLIRRKSNGAKISEESLKRIAAAIDERTSPIKVEPVCKLHRCKADQAKHCKTCEAPVVTPSEGNGFSIEITVDVGVEYKLSLSLSFTPKIVGHSVYLSGCPDSHDCESDFAYHIVLEVIFKGELKLEADLAGLRGARRTRNAVSRARISDLDLSAIGEPVSQAGGREKARAAGWGVGITIGFTKSFTYVVDKVDCIEPPAAAGTSFGGGQKADCIEPPAAAGASFGGGLMPDDGEKPLSIAVKLKRSLSQPGEPLPGLDPFLLGFGQGLIVRLFPLIQSIATGQLNELADRARQINPNYVPTNYSFWCQVATPIGIDPNQMVKAIRMLPLVETAYVLRPVPPPAIPQRPAQPPKRLGQSYLGQARKGINARYVREHYAGGDGAGIGFVDIEQGWNLRHRDLPRRIPLISGANHKYFDHGTSVLGIVLMVDNRFGGIGVAPSARGRVASQWVSGVPNTTDAIIAAAHNLKAGDVMLLEVQEDPGNGAQMPAEVHQGNFEAICDAVAAGIVVVEAAANNITNLDTYVDSSKVAIFNRNVRDSGAIMVGASSSTHPYTRTFVSNYGSRV